jgi:uncharacterized protein (TIGR02996 family)
MTHGDAFLRAIFEAPDDDAPRLVYADWLEENGDPFRAEFIRVQCELARTRGGASLQAREQALLEAYQGEWLGPLRRWAVRWTFHRGFLVEVAVPLSVYIFHRAALALLAPRARVVVDLSRAQIPPYVLELVPESVARENRALPVGWRNHHVLAVAVADPTDWDALTKLQFILHRDIEPVPVLTDQLTEALNRLYGDAETASVDTPLFIDPPPFYYHDVEDDRSAVARLVDLIIKEALHLHATKIRIEPQADHLRVHYRINGQWVERDTPPRRLRDPIVERIRVLSAATPGRIRGTNGDTAFDLSVNIEATSHGPCVVFTVIEW